MSGENQKNRKLIALFVMAALMRGFSPENVAVNEITNPIQVFNAFLKGFADLELDGGDDAGGDDARSRYNRARRDFYKRLSSDRSDLGLATQMVAKIFEGVEEGINDADLPYYAVYMPRHRASEDEDNYTLIINVYHVPDNLSINTFDDFKALHTDMMSMHVTMRRDKGGMMQVAVYNEENKSLFELTASYAPEHLEEMFGIEIPDNIWQAHRLPKPHFLIEQPVPSRRRAVAEYAFDMAAAGGQWLKEKASPSKGMRAMLRSFGLS